MLRRLPSEGGRPIPAKADDITRRASGHRRWWRRGWCGVPHDDDAAAAVGSHAGVVGSRACVVGEVATTSTTATKAVGAGDGESIREGWHGLSAGVLPCSTATTQASGSAVTCAATPTRVEDNGAGDVAGKSRSTGRADPGCPRSTTSTGGRAVIALAGRARARGRASGGAASRTTVAREVGCTTPTAAATTSTERDHSPKRGVATVGGLDRVGVLAIARIDVRRTVLRAHSSRTDDDRQSGSRRHAHREVLHASSPATAAIVDSTSTSSGHDEDSSRGHPVRDGPFACANGREREDDVTARGGGCRNAPGGVSRRSPRKSAHEADTGSCASEGPKVHPLVLDAQGRRIPSRGR